MGKSYRLSLKNDEIGVGESVWFQALQINYGNNLTIKEILVKRLKTYSEKKDCHMISIDLEKQMIRCLEAYIVGLGDKSCKRVY